MNLQALLLAVGLIALAYLVGAIPVGVVIARLIGGPDPRTVGSGRTGGANVARTLGLRWAILAGLLDVAKGAAAAGLPILLQAGDAVVIVAALAAVVGHSRSLFIGFGGGRGVSPGFGGLLVIAWPAALAGMPVFALVFLVTRISSIASLSASLAAGVAMIGVTYAWQLSPLYVAYAVIGTGLVWYFHLDNIRRLLAGEERQFGGRPRTPGPAR
ncbi:MAG: glycerol-3-phosphate 1-O-acyltransferase PlsY [Candidatus Limnocylindrales bacterium]